MRKYVPLFEEVEFPPEFTGDEMTAQMYYILVMVITISKKDMEAAKLIEDRNERLKALDAVESKFVYMFVYNEVNERIKPRDLTTEAKATLADLKERFSNTSLTIGQIVSFMRAKYDHITRPNPVDLTSIYDTLGEDTDAVQLKFRIP